MIEQIAWTWNDIAKASVIGVEIFVAVMLLWLMILISIEMVRKNGS